MNINAHCTYLLLTDVPELGRKESPISVELYCKVLQIRIRNGQKMSHIPATYIYAVIV